MRQLKSYIELITAEGKTLVIMNGFAFVVCVDENGMVKLAMECIGDKNKCGSKNPQNLESIRDALAYMMDNPGEDNDLSQSAENRKIILHFDDGETMEAMCGVLYNADRRNFYFVGIGCDSPYIELLLSFTEERLAQIMEKAGEKEYLGNAPLPSGFDVSGEDERFLKAIPHHKPRKDLKLRTAFDYVSSGIFVFAYTKEEEEYIHRFAKITGISDCVLEKGQYEFYPYVTIRNRMMIPVRSCNWDNVISCRALLGRMHDNGGLFEKK